MSEPGSEAEALTKDEALAELARRGIIGPDVWLLDVLPLVEMAWSDGAIQPEERQLIAAFLEEHVEAVNREAGQAVASMASASAFVQRFLATRPTAQEFRELRMMLRVLRLAGPQREVRARRIVEAASNVGGVSPSPSDPRTPWDRAEVQCLWELEASLLPR